MKNLIEALESLDLQDVKTYIQSGNAVFRSAEENPTKIANRNWRTVVKIMELASG